MSNKQVRIGVFGTGPAAHWPQFPLGPAEFVDRRCQERLTHHCALGVGHQGNLPREAASLLGIPLVEVC